MPRRAVQKSESEHSDFSNCSDSESSQVDSTPATSVRSTTAKRALSRTVTSTSKSRSGSTSGMAAAAAAVKREEEDPSDLSELEEEKEDAQPALKRVKTVKSTTASSTTVTSISSSRRASRRPSPEVVIYMKASSSSNKRVRSTLELKEEEEDVEEEDEEKPFVKRPVRPSPHRKRSSVTDSEESDQLDETESDDEPLRKAAVAKKDIKGKGRAVSPALSDAPTLKLKPNGKGKQAAKPAPPKKMTKSKAKVDVKGKGKGKAKSKKEHDSDGSDFVDEDEDDEDEDEESEEEESELSDLDSDAEMATTQAGTPAAAVAAVKKRARRSKTEKKEKLNWWQKNELALKKHHPELATVWEDLKLLPIPKPQKAEQPALLTMQLLPFQLEGLHWMVQQEQGPWKGGMLADEMGMGKTIQTISLIMSDHISAPEQSTKKHHTLVIAPTVAIMQWRNEFSKFTSGTKICVWHGGNRSNDKKELLKFDVVLTSYAVLESAFRRQNTGYKRKNELFKEESILHSIEWHRVILDEAHNIKDRSCNTARGAFALKADFRWCLSGTPLQNRVGELYSLIRFLGADPFSFYYCKRCPCKALHWRFSNKRHCDECGHTPMHHICYWNNEVLKPIQKYGASLGHGKGAFEKLSLLLARMMLRRTKVERADDMGLPPRDVVVRRDYFTEEEEEFYSSLYTDVKRTFSTYVAADSLLNNYANVFQLLTRMRQTACHPDMVLKGKAAKALLGDKAGLADQLTFSTCRICLDEGEDPIMSKCRHVFCRDCIRQYLETAVEVTPECPVCHLPMTIDLNQEADEELLKARQGMLEKVDPSKWRTSTKIEALVEELSKLKTEDHSIKSLVFSQFTSFLDLIARRLQLAGFKIARLQGNMTPEARDRTVKYFMNTTDCTVFLLSLKAGGVALNLTEASRVFIMDPWWNPSAEVQAMDRIHRIGQHRPVLVKRLIIENSIESKIVELQKKKEAMIGAALGDDDQALGRLTPEDLAFLFTM